MDPQQPALFEQLGGAPKLRHLVDAFYDAMDARPDAAVIRAMHPDDLTSSREHLYLFLQMWTGGPRTYLEQRGHPRMRARHLPFAIGAAERDAWLACMEVALQATVEGPGLRAGLQDAFTRIAEHMRNR